MKKISILLISFVFLSCGTQKVIQDPEPKNNNLDFINLFDARETEGVECYRIPAIVTAPNGDLLASIDERVPGCADLRGSRDINIVQRRSSDNGKTWSDIEMVIDFPDGQSASDPSMIVDEETGDIFLFYNYMDLDKEKDVYYLHVMKSTDNGKTWEEPQDITSQISKPEWHDDFKFITSGRGIQTKDGRLLHTLVNLENGLHLFGSDDHGKSWFLIDSPIKPANESKVIQLANGDYMINSRVNTREGHRYVHISNDKGKTWATKPEPQLVDPGNNASILRYTSVEDGYDKNRLLFSNSNDAKDRKNLTVRISYDEGKTWSDGKTVYAGGSAYSSMTILENGEIGVFFEKDDYKENAFVSFSLEWLTDGEDKYKQAKNKPY
ncbi:sialidase family protein [Gramella sp. AN32]|uniref:exo-alpha-sialidase n=1 Tax=Christiangramia antarctica TaxID=2058158 RepID=A0ABW5X4D2_9FLAO|nr:sialidase family protein [Gramella sp. AN32]MCM4157017.1 exo-alpha-sialidase [Gramella sp. AN32]